MTKTFFRLLLTVAIINLRFAYAQDITAVLCALPEEIAIYQQQAEQKEVTHILGIKFTTGVYKNRKIVFAESGVGKVNAALTTTLMIEHFKPSRVIFTGIAGGLNPAIKPGDIIIADSLAQHDFGTLHQNQAITRWGSTNPVTAKKNPVFFSCDTALLRMAKAIAPSTTSSAYKIVNGIIVTGDQFISSTQKKNELRRNLKADAVEMEGGATAQVCYQLGTPFIIIRSISDAANNKARVDYEVFKKIAAQNAGSFVLHLIEKLPTSKEEEGKYYKVELFFGLSSEGKVISEEEWQNFVDRHITPEFPSGLTILNADGQWQDKTTKDVGKEKSKLVLLVCPKNLSTERSLKTIKEKYCQMFKQQAVMQVNTELEEVSF